MATKSKKREPLTPIPSPRKSPAQRTTAARSGGAPAGEAPPDLSHIAEGLRPLAVLCSSIEFDPANARKHGEENLTGIRASLRVYGQRKPIVVNRRTNTVESGNGTLASALALNWTHIATVFVDDDPTTAAGFSIADNRTAELADWDQEALDKLLREVQTGDEGLAAMFDSLAKAEGIVPKDESSTAAPESEATPEKHVDCPSCGHRFVLASE